MQTNYMDDIVLLLTACINPNGMSYTVVQDIDYVKSSIERVCLFI